MREQIIRQPRCARQSCVTGQIGPVQRHGNRGNDIIPGCALAYPFTRATQSLADSHPCRNKAVVAQPDLQPRHRRRVAQGADHPHTTRQNRPKPRIGRCMQAKTDHILKPPA